MRTAAKLTTSRKKNVNRRQKNKDGSRKTRNTRIRSRRKKASSSRCLSTEETTNVPIGSANARRPCSDPENRGRKGEGRRQTQNGTDCEEREGKNQVIGSRINENELMWLAPLLERALKPTTSFNLRTSGNSILELVI
jgi:hypothetical protein